MNPWIVSAHAIKRGASRLGLIIDREMEKEISSILDSDVATLLRIGKDTCHYKIHLRGVKVIMVCNARRRVVLTILNTDRFYLRKSKLKIDLQESDDSERDFG